MDTLWKALKFAARMLARNPGFTAVAVVTLSLGIGANTALFSVIHALLIRPLPLDEPDRIAFLHEKNRHYERMSVSYANYLDWEEQQSVFDVMAIYRWGSFNLTGTDRPERLQAAEVSASLFPLLRGEPLLGRTFLEEEDEPKAEPVVLLSHRLWQRRFGANPEIVDQTIFLDGVSYRVVGVMPRQFHYPLDEPDTEIYVPVGRFSEVWKQNRNNHPGLWAIARLKPGLSIVEAQANMDTIARRLEAAYPKTNTGHEVRVYSLHDYQVRNIRPALMILLAGVGFVLLIACANVANLLMAKATARSQEIAVRTALGAGRRRVIGQLLSESILLSLLGGLLGVLIALLGVRLLSLLIPDDLPLMYQQIQVDWAVLFFTVILSVITGLVFGLVPALQTSKPNLVDSLKEGGRSSSVAAGRQRLRGALVIGETALALMLLVSAGLVTRSFINILHEDPGFDPEGLFAADIMIPGSKYPEDAQQAAFYEQLVEDLTAQSDVRSVGLVLPFLGGMQNTYVVEGRPVPEPGNYHVTDVHWVNPDYFKTMEIPLLRGRTFGSGDRFGTKRVAVVDQIFAEKHWPGDDPLGKRVKLGTDPAGERPWLQIVGIVGHVKSYGVDAFSREQIYFPYLQETPRMMTLVVKTQSDPETMAAIVRSEVMGIDPDQPIFDVRTMEGYLADRLMSRRLLSSLITLFAAIALVLAAVGLYGLIAFTVAQRAHEIGIRMAMGARVTDILTMVLGRGMRLAVIGVSLGLVGTLAMTPLIASQLFGIGPRDPWTFAGIAFLLTVLALVATLIPARRASRIAPVVALRYE